MRGDKGSGAPVLGSRQGRAHNTAPPSRSPAPKGAASPFSPLTCLQLTPSVPWKGKRGLSCSWYPSVAPASWVLISYQSKEDRKQGVWGGAWVPAHAWKGEAASWARMLGFPILAAALSEEARREDQWTGLGFWEGEEASRGFLSPYGGSEACLVTPAT